MTASFYLQKHRAKGWHDEVVSLSNKCIHIYINPQTQSGYHVITHSYKVHQTLMGREYKYNQYSLLNLIVGDNQNYTFIRNTKIAS